MKSELIYQWFLIGEKRIFNNLGERRFFELVGGIFHILRGNSNIIVCDLKVCFFLKDCISNEGDDWSVNVKQ